MSSLRKLKRHLFLDSNVTAVFPLMVFSLSCPFTVLQSILDLIWSGIRNRLGEDSCLDLTDIFRNIAQITMGL